VERIQACLRDSDSLGYIDERHMLALLDEHRGEGAETVAQRMIECLAEPVVTHGAQYLESASIGIACYPSDAEDAASLLRCADVALQQARELGRDVYRAYRNIRPAPSGSLEAELRAAFGANEFELWYAPQVACETGALRAAVATLRWNHPRRGPLPAEEFMPTLEASGLIVPIGTWMLQTACTQMQSWQETGVAIPRITVSLSAKQLRRRLADEIARVLCDTNVDPGCIELELGRNWRQSGETHRPLFEELKSFGVRLAIDDFGQSEWTLAQLQHLAPHVLKVDPKFIGDVRDESALAAILDGVARIAKGMGIDLVVAQVESAERAALLRLLRCDGAEGAFFGMPAPAHAFAESAPQKTWSGGGLQAADRRRAEARRSRNAV
jgi:EAL domain-containing protein (putative c-di-GMP-specific phosphodiesterase class I)